VNVPVPDKGSSSAGLLALLVLYAYRIALEERKKEKNSHIYGAISRCSTIGYVTVTAVSLAATTKASQLALACMQFSPWLPREAPCTSTPNNPQPSHCNSYWPHLSTSKPCQLTSRCGIFSGIRERDTWRCRTTGIRIHKTTPPELPRRSCLRRLRAMHKPR
jgi:hypothetical protein